MSYCWSNNLEVEALFFNGAQDKSEMKNPQLYSLKDRVVGLFFS